MKPEDVMRALECCGNSFGCHGEECPLFVTKGDCIRQTMKAAIALLRENRSQISVLKKLLERCETQFAEKDAEIERLSSRVSMLHEIELSYALQYGDAIDKDIARKQLRAEDITEFFERVCKEVEQTPNANEFFINAWKEKFEEIAKEMKEGENGESNI